MKYDIKIYEPTKTNPNFRYTLGTEGSKPLFVIGLNPSTADDKEPDQTMRRVSGYAERHGCDSFIMFNLYAQRTPYPKNLPTTFDNQLHSDNVFHIKATLDRFDDISILAAWGGDITIRSYLKKCLTEIFRNTNNKNIKWLKIGDMTQSGHPRHPSRGAYLKLTDFDIDSYLKTIK
jgi:hypothetical protein